ncbi:MAG: GGDEF domain-containing protein, partial [Acidimicrobiia bacterium]
SARLDETLALVVIDLDDFKLVNDRHGHEGGDEVLCRFAATARRALRSVDVIARTGGDEFAVLLPDVDAATTVGVLQRLRGALGSEDAGGIRCSMGVACLTGGTLSDALRSADKALYGAKTAGKGSILLVDLVSESPQDPRSVAAGSAVPDALGQPDCTWSPGGSRDPSGSIFTAAGFLASSSGPVAVCAGSPPSGREDGGTVRTLEGVPPDSATSSGEPGTWDPYPQVLIRRNGDMVVYDQGSKPDPQPRRGVVAHLAS